MEHLPYDPDWIVPKEGMNDQGLFYSVFYAPYLLPENETDKPTFISDDPDYYQYGLYTYCLAKCTTVAEVLDIFDDYNLVWMNECQVFFADRYGDSVIIEGDEIIYREGNFQVLTNFYQNHPECGGYPCWRYNTAVSMLENMTDLSVEYFQSICNATHQRTTVHSNVYDLQHEMLYVNYYNNFEKTLVFDLNEELAKGERRIHLGSLFDSYDNHPPDKPEPPTGESSGIPGEEYRYSCKKTRDPDGDRVMVLFDWGDGFNSGWIAQKFGTVNAYHNWSKRGNYEVKVKGMDIYGRESEWSDSLQVIVPKSKRLITPFQQFLENHPHLFPILRQLFRL